jgi:phosphate butyryltransferase
MELRQLEQIKEIAIRRKTRRLVVAAGEDAAVLSAIKTARELDIVIPILTGNEKEIRALSSRIGLQLDGVKIINEEDPVKASRLAVAEIRQGNADILMKGRVSTAPLLKAVLNRDEGLRKRDNLSHLALFQTRYYPRLLGITDAAMNISPGIKEKVAIIENAKEIFHALGIVNPRIAVLGPIETVNPDISSTTDAAILVQMNRRNQIPDCLIDGPLALDNAVSAEAAEHKGIVSEVSGKVDILLAPDLNSGNILYKSLSFLSDGRSAAIILGAQVPVVLTSRADSEESKLYSIALAAAV